MQQMLETALQAGVSYADFWDMTIGEVVLIVKAFNEKEVNNYKKEIALNYALAQNVATAIACKFAGKQVPSLYETYPNLFQEQKNETTNNNDIQPWMLYKEQFIDFANSHNKKRGDKIKNDN